MQNNASYNKAPKNISLKKRLEKTEAFSMVTHR